MHFRVEFPLWSSYYRTMINTLTFEEAVLKCPAISATSPSPKASKSYNFIPTGEIINKALENDWLIRDVKGNKGIHGMHNVSLIHRSQVDQQIVEGFPQINITNSHNLSRRFSLTLGYFRLICSNGLIAPTGMVTGIQPTLHRQGKLGSTESILCSLDNAFSQYDNVITKTQEMKERILSKEEQRMLARFAYYSRFRYRMAQPKKVQPDNILAPRRVEDEKNDLWTTFNVIQENLMRGGNHIGTGITRFQDELRFNQELWVGIDKAITLRDSSLESSLKSLFPKKDRLKKNSSVDN